MHQKRAHETRKQRAGRLASVVSDGRHQIDSPTTPWIGEQSRLLAVAGFVAITVCTLFIYHQTLTVPALDYEDSFYLVHSPYTDVRNPWNRLPAVWTEPYFANFHPVTTTTWLLDRALADKDKAFDAVPFRMAQLVYATVGAALLLLLYWRLGIPKVLAVLGALMWAAHPVHTEVVAWLSARKDLISFLFIVLSLLAWIWARNSPTTKRWRVRNATTILLTLLAVLSKPIAVILPPLFIAYEFCSAPHPGIGSWRWRERNSTPSLTRSFAFVGIFVAVGGLSAVFFRQLLMLDHMRGGWLIVVAIAISALLLVVAPSEQQMAAFREGRSIGMRVLAPAFAASSVVFGAGCAWTFWAQNQVGAIKGALPLLSTFNLTFDAMLSYLEKALVPLRMSISYNWSEYPYLSVRGVIGAGLIRMHVMVGDTVCRFERPATSARRVWDFLVLTSSDSSLEFGTHEHENGRPLPVCSDGGSDPCPSRIGKCLGRFADETNHCLLGFSARGLRLFFVGAKPYQDLVRGNCIQKWSPTTRLKPVERCCQNQPRRCSCVDVAWADLPASDSAGS